jgi:hypothetical protein
MAVVTAVFPGARSFIGDGVHRPVAGRVARPEPARTFERHLPGFEAFAAGLPAAIPAAGR